MDSRDLVAWEKRKKTDLIIALFSKKGIDKYQPKEQGRALPYSIVNLIIIVREIQTMQAKQAQGQ